MIQPMVMGGGQLFPYYGMMYGGYNVSVERWREA